MRTELSCLERATSDDFARWALNTTRGVIWSDAFWRASQATSVFGRFNFLLQQLNYDYRILARMDCCSEPICILSKLFSFLSFTNLSKSFSFCLGFGSCRRAKRV